MGKCESEKDSELGQFPHTEMLYDTLVSSDQIGLALAQKRSFYFRAL